MNPTYKQPDENDMKECNGTPTCHCFHCNEVRADERVKSADWIEGLRTADTVRYNLAAGILAGLHDEFVIINRELIKHK